MTAAGRFPASGSDHPGEALSALLDGELDEGEAEAVGRHLADCLECRLEMARLSDARSRLRSLTPVAAPAELAERTRARIGWQRRAVALAAVLVGAGAGLVLWSSRPEAEVSALPAGAYSLVQSSLGGPSAAARSSNLATAAPVVATTAVTVSVSGPAAVVRPVPLGSLPAGYVAPSVIDGLTLGGIWRRGGVLAAVYGQGAARLLLLEQAGRLVSSSRQRWTELGSRRGQAGTWGLETTFASQVGPDLVVTAVGSDQDVAEVAATMGNWRVNPPWLYRTRTLARHVVEEMTGT